MRKLRMTQETATLVRSLHPNLKRKIKAALQCIVDQPHAGKALRHELKGLRTFRVATFRIVYKDTNSNIIEIVAIGPRKRIYDETLSLIKKEAQSD